jgi:hypothetical protein
VVDVGKSELEDLVDVNAAQSPKVSPASAPVSDAAEADLAMSLKPNME